MYKYLIFLLLIAACKSPKPNMDMQKMVNILTDIHVVENYASLYFKDSTSKKINNKNIDTLKKYYQIVFEKYKITSKDFYSNYKLYSKDKILSDTLYKKISAKMELLKAKVDKAANKDSLNKGLK